MELQSGEYITRLRKVKAAGRQAGRLAGRQRARTMAGVEGRLKFWQDLSVTGASNLWHATRRGLSDEEEATRLGCEHWSGGREARRLRETVAGRAQRCGSQSLLAGCPGELSVLVRWPVARSHRSSLG